MAKMTKQDVLLEITCVDDLWDLNVPDYYSDRDISEDELSHIFTLCDALWLHSGDPKQPHAELTSGKCSDGFVDVLRVLCFTNLCEIFGNMLVNNFRRYMGSQLKTTNADWVIGSDHAGADLSHSVALELLSKHDFTEKGPDKTQVWKRFTIQPEEVVLQVEELITTTKTLRAVREGIRNGNPYPVQFTPVVMTLVHRSDTYEFEGFPILYGIHYDIKTWEPKECPLCAQGSKRMRPKTIEGWAKLTGK
ncbi:hypothetical protein ACFL3E_02175 [Patescibacteria group bacterium]